METLARQQSIAEPVRVEQPLGASPRAEVPALTGLRFVAAFSVVIAHGSETILNLLQGSSFGPAYWMGQLAGLGMELFFVLSGFVIHYNYRQAVTQGGLDGVSGFIWARFARLYPLYAFIVTLDILLGRKLFDIMAGNGDEFLEVLRALPYYLTLTHSWFYVPLGDRSLVYAIGTPSTVTWSISTEWFFYLSYPFVALLVIRLRRPIAVIVAALILCVIAIEAVSILFSHSLGLTTWATGHYGSIAQWGNENSEGFFRWLLYLSPYLRIFEFILGCLVAQLYVQLQQTPPKKREKLAGSVLLAIGVASIPVLIYQMYAGHLALIRELNFDFGLAPSVALVMFCAARYDTFFSRILNSRPFVALGDASYSIYLIHMLIFAIAGGYLGDTLPHTATNIVFMTSKFLFFLALILLISLGLHAFLEVPARQWLRGIWRSRSATHNRAMAYSILAIPGTFAVIIAIALPSVLANSTTSVANGIEVISASYGANCGVPRGNATRALTAACNGKEACQFTVDVQKLGDSAPGCAKAFVVDYDCSPDSKRLIKEIPGEAGLGSQLMLACKSEPVREAKAGPAAAQTSTLPQPSKPHERLVDATPIDASHPTSTELADASVANAKPADATPTTVIHVRSATYGGNCGAPGGNATSDVAMTCDGEKTCTYSVDVNRLGDPAQACGKAFTLEYDCGPGTSSQNAELPGEAGFGKEVVLRCASSSTSGGPPELPTDSKGSGPAGASPAGIQVLSATYGGNCGAVIGNATEEAALACGGKATCDFAVNATKLGDPAMHCPKSFFVKYRCPNRSIALTTAVPGEAAFRKPIHLACPEGQ